MWDKDYFMYWMWNVARCPLNFLVGNMIGQVKSFAKKLLGSKANMNDSCGQVDIACVFANQA